MVILGDTPRRQPTAKRKDVLVDDDQELARKLERALNSLKGTHTSRPALLDTERGEMRQALLDTDVSDLNGLERVIGASDLVSINFLSHGLRASRAVCRIRVPSLGGEWCGTGFLVGPNLLATNNHVLASQTDAAQALAEFDFEHDADGILSPPVQFGLAPHEVFFTDVKHDISLVSVVPLSSGGIPLERFGYLPLVPLSGKGLHGEWVTIIQHPGGDPKQMAVRACQIVDLEPDAAGFATQAHDRRHLIHYSTDTEPGSSGAPVVNDQWQVVAIHHKAIPKPGKETDLRLKRGEDPEWLANEGIRISAISNLLETRRFMDRQAAGALVRIEQGLGVAPLSLVQSVPRRFETGLERDPGPHGPGKWKDWGRAYRLGYDPDFIAGISIPFESIVSKVTERLAPLLDGDGHVLDYLHFSTAVHATRKFPILTAVNIDGDKAINTGAREGRFRIDARMDAVYQPAANFYEKALSDDPVVFSRGHLVRRIDPSWGDDAEEAKAADGHTFHYSNAAPQVQGFNIGDWGYVEDYVLDRAQTKGRKMSVFAGPVFRDNDPEYGHRREGGPWSIPISFWKIVVVEKAPGVHAATAFLTGQLKFVEALYEAKVFSVRRTSLPELQSKLLQTTIAAVEKETDLDFSALHRLDALAALESTRGARLITSPADIVI